MNAGYNILEEEDELVMKNRKEISQKLQPQQKRYYGRSWSDFENFFIGTVSISSIII